MYVWIFVSFKWVYVLCVCLSLCEQYELSGSNRFRRNMVAKPTYTYAYIHTNVHTKNTNIRIHKQTHVHTHMHKRSHTNIKQITLIHTYKCTQAYTHNINHRNKYLYTRTYIHHSHIHKFKQTSVYTFTHFSLQSRTFPQI